MKLLQHKQGSVEWLEMRRKGIGASDAPIIMHVSPWTVPYELWLQKTSGKEKEMNASMRYGKETEEEERKEFEKMIGTTFFPDMTFASNERAWALASLDGIDFDQTVIMEIKQANQKDHESAKNGKIPEKYFPQLQHQMYVCKEKNITRNLYCSSHKGDRVVVEVKRDDAYIEKMLKAEDVFYYENLVKGIPPLTEDMLEYAAVLKNVDGDIKRLEEEREYCKNALISLSNGRPFKAYGVTLTKSEYKGSIDYDAIPELFGVDKEKYRKPSQERWTLRIA